MPDQAGRVVLITGANSGLGLESARALAARGARVLLACRTLEKAAAAQRNLGPLGEACEPLALDLSDLEAVAAAAQQLQQRHGHLDLLLANAGVMAPPRTLTRQGFELQFGVNHLAHYLLTRLLLPLLRAQPGARVVHVTSGAQYFGRLAFDDPNGERRYDRWAAYGQSKLANVAFALELQRRLSAAGWPVWSLAAHPGLARTNLQPASVAASGAALEAWAYRLMDPLFQSAAMGALPQLFAATASEAEPGGHYGPSRFGGLNGWPAPALVAPAARDPHQGARLWQLSEQLCLQVLPGLELPALPPAC